MILKQLQDSIRLLLIIKTSLLMMQNAQPDQLTLKSLRQGFAPPIKVRRTVARLQDS